MINETDIDLNSYNPIEHLPQGLVLLEDGRVAGLDAKARVIFQQTGLFDGNSSSEFSRERIRRAFEYIENTLRTVKLEEGDPWAATPSPAVRFLSHRTGLVLKLVGVRVEGPSAKSTAAIHVTAGEKKEHRRVRIQHRLGLSQRMMEVLIFVAYNLNEREMAQRMMLSRSTIKDYLRRLRDQLELESRASLRQFSRELEIA